MTRHLRRGEVLQVVLRGRASSRVRQHELYSSLIQKAVFCDRLDKETKQNDYKKEICFQLCLSFKSVQTACFSLQIQCTTRVPPSGPGLCLDGAHQHPKT